MNLNREDWRDAAMLFSLEIARESDNFPKKVLALLDKHFGCKRSIFFPYHYANVPEGAGRRNGTLNNYITFGMRYGTMYDYKDHLYKEDIFRYSTLPSHLKGKRVLLTQDVMPLAEYEATPYGKHMTAKELHYQAVLFFFQGDRRIGSLGLFHTQEEGPFQESHRQPLQFLAETIEANYQNYLRCSGEARFQDSFHLFFQDIRVGAVILNQDMSVMQANKAAQKISKLFWDQYRHSQGNFLRSNYHGDPNLREVQTMINEVSDRMATQGSVAQTITSLAGDITFYHTSFLSARAAGLIQTWHLMIITYQDKEVPQGLDHPYNTLTQQERRIAHHLASGMKNEQIAEELHISIYTVRTHIANIYKKFEVNNKVDLLMHLQPILKDPGFR